jgi:hypothetical protein
MNTADSQTNSLHHNIAEACVDHRWLFSTFSLIITLVLAAGLVNISYETSYETFLPADDPYLEEVESVSDLFSTNSDGIISFIITSISGKPIFTTVVINALSDLKKKVQSVPESIRLSSILDHYSPQKGQRLFTKNLIEYSQDDLDLVLEEALFDQLLTNSLISPDARITFGNVILGKNLGNSENRRKIAEAAIAIRDDLQEKYPELKILVMSDIISQQAETRAMTKDLTSLLPIIVIACVVAICAIFQSLFFGLCILALIGFTVLCNIGTLGWLDIKINSVSVIAPLVVVIISVANSVHIISLFKQSLQKKKTSFSEAMCSSLTKNFSPVLLAALTTSIGFLSLRLSSSPAIQSFGLVVAVGILYAFIFTFTLLPNLLIQSRFFSKNLTGTIRKSKLENFLGKVSRFAIHNDKILFLVFSLISITTLPLLGLNDSNFDRLNFISGGDKVREPYEMIREQLNRGSALVYGIDTGEIDGAITPPFLKNLEEYLSWATQLPAVESTASLIDIAKAVNQNQHQGNIKYFRIPDTTDAIANALLAYEVVESYDFPLKNFVTEDFSTLQLRINAAPLTNQEVIDLDQDLVEEFQKRFPSAKLLHGSPLLLFARMDERVTVELLQGYSVSLILITLSLIVGFQSFYFGILSVIPNLLPATIVFGLWGLIVGQIDPFVMMLFSISIGLVVDDTVHLLTHYLEKRRENFEDRDAISSAIKIAGPALTITTFILALGCIMLVGANTLYFQQAAKLLVPIVVVALILDLLYLPALLKRLAPEIISRKRPA